MTTLLIAPESPLSGNAELVACAADGDEEGVAKARERYNLAAGGEIVDYEVIAGLLLTDAPQDGDEVVVSRHRGTYRCAAYPYDVRGKRYLYAVRRQS